MIYNILVILANKPTGTMAEQCNWHTKLNFKKFTLKGLFLAKQPPVKSLKYINCIIHLILG